MRKLLFLLFAVLLLAAATAWYVARPQAAGPAPEVLTLTPKAQPREAHAIAGLIRSGRGRDTARTPEPAGGESDVDAGPALQPDTDRREIIPGEFLFSFYSDKDLQAFLALARELGVTVSDDLGLGHTVRIRASRDQLARLRREGPLAVEFDWNRVVRNPTLPSLDPKAPEGYYRAFGGDVLKWLGVSDNAEWGKGITVAVLDSGVNGHPVLNGINLKRLDVLGGDGTDPTQDGAHGTAVTSLIAGRGEVQGVAPAVDILSIRAIAETGKGDTFSMAKGIMAAVDAGADIINISAGTRTDSFPLRDAVAYAKANGVLIVASAGNDGVEGVSYPGGYDGVMTVPSVDAGSRHMYFSNRGDALDVAAPGLGILAASTGDTVAPFSGTSASAPLVTAAIASIMSEDPTLSAADAARILEFYSNDGGQPGADPELGTGVIDMKRVQERDQSGIYDVALGTPYLTQPNPDEDIVLMVVVQNRGTEPIAAGGLRVVIDGTEYSAPLQGLAVSESRGETFRIPASSLESTGTIDVSARAWIDGANDTRSWNDTQHLSVFWEPPAPDS